MVITVKKFTFKSLLFFFKKCYMYMYSYFMLFIVL